MRDARMTTALSGVRWLQGASHVESVASFGGSSPRMTERVGGSGAARASAAGLWPPAVLSPRRPGRAEGCCAGVWTSRPEVGFHGNVWC